MNALKSIKVLGIAATAIGLSWGAADAAITNLSITNPSFEDPVIGAPGGATSSAPTGWLGGSQVGAFQPVTPMGSYNVPIPNGVQVGYIHETGFVAQVTAHQLVAGGTYTLDVQVGDRTETSIGTYRLALMLEDPMNPGNTGVATILANASNPAAPVEGAFVNASLNYVAPAVLGALAGRNLIIFLDHLLSGEPVLEQVNFDDVRLTLRTEDPPNGGTIPEPATLALFGLGLAGLGLYRRRRTA